MELTHKTSILNGKQTDYVSIRMFDEELEECKGVIAELERLNFKYILTEKGHALIPKFGMPEPVILKNIVGGQWLSQWDLPTYKNYIYNYGRKGNTQKFKSK